MRRLEQVKENISKVIIGKESLTDLILTALVAGGHVLLEDVPGTGKTVMAKSLARSLDVSFGRIQFTPDLLPADVTGLNYYNQKDGEFQFHPGPVFADIVLADEINRATPRTQSSLLECMEERQVTIDGQTRKLEAPFFVIATQNPVETTGTYPLPEAQLDRFFMKLKMGMPDRQEEGRILERFLKEEPLTQLKAVCSREELRQMQTEFRATMVHPELMNYIVEIVQRSRDWQHVSSGVSPRGSLALLRASQAYAYLQGRAYVVPEDIRVLAVPVLAHRLILNRGFGISAEQLMQDIAEAVPVPTEDWG